MGCKICEHPERTAIEAALEAKGPRAAERAFGVPKTTLLRHRDRCLGGAGAQSATSSQAAPSAPSSSTGHWTAPAAPPPSQPPPTSRTPSLVVTPASNRAPTFSGRPGPGRQCRTCASPMRSEIEAMLCAGVPRWTIARDVPGAPSADSIERHARGCIPDIITRARAEAGAAAALTIRPMVEDMASGVMLAVGDIQEAAKRAREAYEAAPAATGACPACGHDPVDEDRHRNLIRTAKATADVAGKAAIVLKLAAQLSGELSTATQAPIAQHPRWAELGRDLAALVSDDDARSEALAQLLERWEAATS